MRSSGLHLSPFRGLRYAARRVNSLAAVLSPPYDVVVRPDGVAHLETADPHNIVRLILPHAPDPATRHHQAADTLCRWQREGVLERDEAPTLYVYEQRHGEVLQRGLIGALRLDGPVLPHEDVVPEIVADRADLMREAAAQFEPLLLAYDGAGDDASGDASAVIERTVEEAAPLFAATTEDGWSHRLWAVTDPEELAAVDAGLRRQEALIADGHHRWATYLRLREERPGRADWERGLVLLVDSARYPLRVRAIHRVLPRLPLDSAVAASEGLFRCRTVDGSLPDALAALERTTGNAFLLSGGRGSFRLLDRPDPALLERAVRTDRPAGWRRLDATVLHSVLLDAVWQVPDRPSDISYLHSAEAAVDKAHEHGGTAVLLRAVREETVRELADQGVMMPRKSTSFGPKPASGVVLRLLGDEPA
ncbi:DUF1015 family protein [Streptomyces oceani]|uniref:Chromosome partitioning protein ParA n=1 Tax=Streptomyces oceani TaxID=1075402 RepID=A0A1E7KGN7_9ACTN|nr:DUF1015 domain-containing protein [Streptomyces oceani]OEV03085.1 chromosome partitioning protein ParA [Streptomyces oceani]